jgi:hypothetical protein
MNRRTILLAENNPQDELLIPRTLRKRKLSNRACPAWKSSPACISHSTSSNLQKRWYAPGNLLDAY